MIDVDASEAPVLIELKNICQSYKGVEVIKNLSLTIRERAERGQFRMIIGPSGCGKSTLLRYISGLQTPTSGDVLLRGKPRTEDDHVAMVFQQYSCFPWRSVLDNVALGLEFKAESVPLKERQQKARTMLDLVGLLEHASKFAQPTRLSGGQLQRVAIARSLLASPNLLLLDEPFGALDIKTRLQMQELLLSIAYKMGSTTTVLFVTHDISEAVYLGDVIYLIGGSPSQVQEKILVPFGDHRTPELKKEAAFNKLVQEIEEKMMR